MGKVSNKKSSTSLTATERVVLIVTAGVIALFLVSIGFALYVFWGLFLIVLVVDLILLFGGKVPEMIKRLILLVSIAAALLAIYLLTSTHFPYVFQ